MDYRHSIKISLFFTLVFAFGSLQAQDFSLDSVVLYALKHSPNLNAAESRASASVAQAESSRGGHMPTLSLSHTARLSDNPLDAFADKLNTRRITTADFDPLLLNQADSSEMYFTQLALRWSIYNGGRTSAVVKNAEQIEQHRQLQYQREREKITYASIRAYLVVLASEQALVIAEQAVVTAKQHANTTARLARQDRIVESDKLAAEVSLSMMRSEREQAFTRQRMARDKLKMIIGLPLDNEIRLAKSNEAELGDIHALKKYEKEAKNNRKDLAAARALIHAAKADVESARSVHKPSFDLVLSSNWYDDEPGFDSQSMSVMGVFSLDLYNGKNSGKIDSSLARQREMQWQLQSLELSAQKQVRDAYYRLLESRKRLALADDNVQKAKQAVKQVKKRYGQGRTILLDLLQSERLYTSARLEKLTANLNLDISQVALPLAAGTLSLPVRLNP